MLIGPNVMSLMLFCTQIGCHGCLSVTRNSPRCYHGLFPWVLEANLVCGFVLNVCPAARSPWAQVTKCSLSHNSIQSHGLSCRVVVVGSLLPSFDLSEHLRCFRAGHPNFNVILMDKFLCSVVFFFFTSCLGLL